MGIIDVCLYNNNIYNIEDGSILGEIPKGGSIALYGHLCTIRSKYNIKLVIMDFNQPLRNAIYSIFPSASIMIHPVEVIQMINKHLGSIESIDPINNSIEEIAAAIEEESPLTIYDYSTKAEAIYYYRQWQGDVPLGIESFHNVIRTIDYFHEEIFNYYQLKNILLAEKVDIMKILY